MVENLFKKVKKFKALDSDLKKVFCGKNFITAFCFIVIFLKHFFKNKAKQRTIFTKQVEVFNCFFKNRRKENILLIEPIMRIKGLNLQ